MIATFHAPLEWIQWAAATGPDRARFLHAMVSNSVLGVDAGEGNYAVLLTAKGKMVADLHLLVTEEEILLGLPPQVRGRALEMLDRYVVADDVAFELRPFRTRTVVGGDPEALFPDLPEGDHRHRTIEVGGQRVRAARLSWSRQPSVELLVPPEAEEAVCAGLEASGIAAGDAEAVERLRIESGTPRWGAELDENTIPLEAGLEHALDRLKGCYIGQETIVRVLTRGHVNWHIRGLRIEGDTPPPRGTEVLDGEGTVRGEIRSAVASPTFGVIALARLRREVADAGSELWVSGHRAVVVEGPFS
ncbi:MAG: hypothetical protein D6729_00670 [Deltaproteobacteria bacterium]|nr:MAG: hypothetical protein D6729_00670 [Deltaproteobacteria bacterium]